jgi:hypothetical protein
MPHDEKYQIELVAASGGRRPPSPWKLPARWRVEIRGKSKPNLRFVAAIAHDGQLEVVEGLTPYDKEFTASRVILLFQPTREGRLSVIVYSDASGAYRMQSSHESDGSGRFLFDETITPFEGGSL